MTGPATLTRQHRDYRQRPTAWVNAPGATLDSLLADALRARTERVMLCGAVDRDLLDRLAFTAPPSGWYVADSGHYLASVESATLRFVHTESHHHVDLVSAGAWFGQRPARVCADAAEYLSRELSHRFHGGGGSNLGLPMLATPAAQGRDLILRSLPRDLSVPTLSHEDREWWQSVTTQGRWELLPNAANGGELAELAVFDQRFAYAGHCWDLGIGPVRYDSGDTIERACRGMYDVTWRVPHSWDHVGLAPVKAGDGATWRWPNRPGEQHRTWLDGAEADLIARHGWIEQIHRRALLAQARPLDTWAKRLVGCRDRLASLYQQSGDDAVKAAGDALRMVLLASIGALHGRSHAVTRSVTASRASEIPPDARDVRQADGVLIWREDQPPAWEAMCHPEWTGQIWARARRRVLTHPHGRGALHVDRSSLVAVRGDAIYLDHDPGWQPAGRVGELRKIDHVAGPLDYPNDHRELLALRGL